MKQEVPFLNRESSHAVIKTQITLNLMHFQRLFSTTLKTFPYTINTLKYSQVIVRLHERQP